MSRHYVSYRSYRRAAARAVAKQKGLTLEETWPVYAMRPDWVLRGGFCRNGWCKVFRGAWPSGKYDGSRLREIRATKGVGRPPRKVAA